MHYENCTHLVGQVLMHPPGVAWAPYECAAQLHHVVKLAVVTALWVLPGETSTLPYVSEHLS